MKIAVEQISKYYPDKYADAISDEILKGILAEDPNALCGIEVMVKDEKVVVGGEVATIIDEKALQTIVYLAVERVSKELKYQVRQTVYLLGKQSPQINKAVLGNEIGAGDQGIVVGYANIAEIRTHANTPYVAKLVADDIIKAIENDIEKYGQLNFMGDAKCQVIYDTDNKKITEIVVSACHPSATDEIYPPLAILRDYLENKIITDVLRDRGFQWEDIITIKKTINPSGEWTIGGPTADCGLTGRKLVCDAYGPQVQIGGGAQSGKDLTKVDRSGAIVARCIALRLLKTYNFDDVRVEISYVIGKSSPSSVAVFVEGRPSERLAKVIEETYDLTPKGLIKFIKNKNLNIYGRVGQLK